MACLKCVSLLHACKEYHGITSCNGMMLISIKTPEDFTLSTKGSVWQVTGLRWFQTSIPFSVGQKWRTERGQAANNSRYGPLTDLPDYSYLDGRPTPLSMGQRKRRDQRIRIAKRIKTLTDEMFMARDNYKKTQKQIEDERQEILKKKLRPKVTS